MARVQSENVWVTVGQNKDVEMPLNDFVNYMSAFCIWRTRKVKRKIAYHFAIINHLLGGIRPAGDLFGCSLVDVQTKG